MTTVRTVTVKSSGGDYTSLAAAIAGEVGNLVVLDRQLDIVCYPMQDVTVAHITGFTTDATRYVRVVAASGAEAKMPYNTSTSYRLECTIGGGGTVLFVEQDNTRIENIQVKATPSSQDGSFEYFGIQVNAINCRFTKNVIRFDLSSWVAGSTVAYGILGGVDVAGSNYYANNLIYGVDYATHANAIGFWTENHTAGKTYLYNNTIVECGLCVKDGFSDTVAKNNVVKPASGGTGFGASLGTGTDYNASSDATSTGAHARNSQTFTFVSSGTLDYHLSGSDAGAKGFGTDLSADANFPLPDDFDGTTRSAPWDIGLDQVTAGSAGSASGDIATVTASAVSGTASSARSVSVTLRSGTGGLLSGVTRRFWTRTTLDAAASDGGTTGLSFTCDSSGVFSITGLTVSAGAGWLTYKDPADDLNCHNIPVTYS